MHGLIMAAIYVAPFLVLGITTKRSMARRFIALSRSAGPGQPAP
jgi:hypothetical protein